MRRIGSKRKNKKEKSKNSEKEENGVSEAPINDENDISESDDNEENEPIQSKRSRKSANKRVSFAQKKENENENNENDNNDDSNTDEEEAQYEVESIEDHKTTKGITYFLIRWKGYGEESDTWEPESTLNCPQLLKDYKQKMKTSSGKTSKKKSKSVTEVNWNEDEEFEVDRIIEVHHKRDGKREFLVSWKGYPSSANSWEPEENMDCPHLIERFMNKVQKAKEAERHELREIRSPTIRFNSQAHGRRSSKRHSGKRNKEEKLKQFSSERDDISGSESEITHKEKTTSSNCECIKQENDAELVSCYYSASHTDNLSTDEHDSVRESQASSNRSALLIKSLQSSDSGADLSEHLKNDLESSWHKFWASNGERIIWDSWIAKYSDYINPDFIQESSIEKIQLPPLSDESIKKTEAAKALQFSFDKKDVEKLTTDVIPDNKIEETNKKTFQPKNHHFLLRELSGSDSFDKLNGEISEGWNPLSPLSIECEFEVERLITSRCGSHASSSLRTVDSLTNVTRMTVSSIDLSHSSKTSDSISSVSSVQSSLSSTSSEEFDGTQDYNQQWNTLWKNHYEEEYMKNYQQFLLNSHQEDAQQQNDDKVLDIDKGKKKSIFNKVKAYHQSKSNSDDNEFNSDVEIKKIHKKIVSRKLKQKRTLNTVSALFDSLQMDDDVSNQDGDVKKTKFESMDTENKDSSSSYDENVEAEQMSSMGLPIAFGTSFKKKGKSTNLRVNAKKRSHESDSDDVASNNRIKAAFKLMGIELNERQQPILVGNVEYKMKHIRLQNRHLKFHKNIVEKPKHIRFDDDGNPVPTDEEVEPQGSTSDDFEMNPSSTDNEEYDTNRVSPQFKSAAPNTDETVQNRKKKRKRKLNFPIEIKENPKLKKYFQRRFSLFSKFDMGIKLDEESWYSVTPEIVAKHTAQRCKTDIIVDAFCGAGGNSIQFAFTCKKVIAIDIDPKKIEIARNNATVYGVEDRIEFIIGDFFNLANSLKADIVFLSPPWGGPSYLKQSTYELEEFLQPAPLTKLLNAAKSITQNIALFLPRNSNTFDLMKAAGPGKAVEIEQNFINKKLIALTAYYNDLIKNI